MARPGVQVTIRDSIPPRSQATDVDTWFAVGVTERGPSNPVLVRSMAEFERTYGRRTPISQGFWDSVDTYFREGGSKVYIGRVVGPAAVAAFATLSDADAPSVRVTANSPGDWGENYDVAVIAGNVAAERRLQIFNRATNTLVEQSPSFASKGDMLTWLSEYVVLTDVDPTQDLPIVVGRTQLTGGDDDLDAVVDASYTAALTLFNSGLGPGQVSVPGNVDVDVQGAILDHCAVHNRTAILDAPDTNVLATLTTHVTTLRAGTNERYGAIFGPRARVPGIIPNTVREVPYSAVQAGLIARQPNPNEPAAGASAVTQYATSVKYDFTDEQREALNEGGVNVARNMLGGVRTYGYRTLVAPGELPQWLQLNAVRTVMSIKHQAELIAEEHIFRQIDGRGTRISAFQGALLGMLVPYFESGALYGQSPQEAFLVDTGQMVNTPASIADGQLRANIAVRTSPFGELVVIDIVKQPLPTSAGQPLA